MIITGLRHEQSQKLHYRSPVHHYLDQQGNGCGKRGGERRHLQEQHEGKYNIQTKETQDIPGPWIEKLSIVRILVCTKLIYKFNIIPGEMLDQ